MSLIANGINLLHTDNLIHSDIDGIRTSDCGIDKQGSSEYRRDTNADEPITKCDSETSSKCEQRDSNSLHQSPIIFRYKFTEEFMSELYNFSKIHQYDERKDFKDAWKQWLDDNTEIVEEEMSRLNRLGYDGDIEDKMFKSARYYFRKKSTEKIEPKTRRNYISVSKELLELMDIHIEENYEDEDYTPKTGFINFCEENEETIESITNKLVENGVTDLKLINDKIKKTYKNRHFIITNKNR